MDWAGCVNKWLVHKRQWLHERCLKGCCDFCCCCRRRPADASEAAVERGDTAPAFVEGLKKQGKRVPGIGHRIKSKDNRDKRVELLQKYAKKGGAICNAQEMLGGVDAAGGPWHAQPTPLSR